MEREEMRKGENYYFLKLHMENPFNFIINIVNIIYSSYSDKFLIAPTLTAKNK